MDQPFDKWLANKHKGFYAPLDVALQVIKYFDTPEDIINYALSHRDLLDYWIAFSGPIQERWQSAADPESNPRGFEPNPVPTDPIALATRNAARDATFWMFSKRIVERLFSPGAQRCLSTAISMPNPSDRIWDIDYRRANPEIDDIPFADLWTRKTSRFQYFWKQFNPSKGANLLFSFKSMNRVSPIVTASRRFALDFMKKAGTRMPSLAHHSPPEFAHPSLNLPGQVFQDARQLRNETDLPDFSKIHETEQERLLCSFYMYETLCATTWKRTGYPEICHALAEGQAAEQRQAETDALTQARDAAINAGQQPPNTLPPGTVLNVTPYTIESWHLSEIMQSPFSDASGCQVERVRCVYMYVRLQYQLIFHALLMEWREYLAVCAVSYNTNAAFFASQDSTPQGYAPARVPPMFRNKTALDEWIDVLCSRGLVFLHEILCLSADERRQMLVNTFYPTRWAQGPMGDQDYLVKGFFHQASTTNDLLMNNDTDFSHSDKRERALDQNWSWVRYNTFTRLGLIDVHYGFHYEDDQYNPLRRRGWVFWNKPRTMAMDLNTRSKMIDIYTHSDETPVNFLNGTGFLDHPGRGNQVDLEFTAFPAIYPEAVWQQAMIPFQTPPVPPAVLQFPILGETIRVWQDRDQNGNPIAPRL